MKIKIGDDWFEATPDQPIMVQLSPSDRQNITDMANDSDRYACFSDDDPRGGEEMYKWMKQGYEPYRKDDGSIMRMEDVAPAEASGGRSDITGENLLTNMAAAPSQFHPCFAGDRVVNTTNNQRGTVTGFNCAKDEPTTVNIDYDDAEDGGETVPIDNLIRMAPESMADVLKDAAPDIE